MSRVKRRPPLKPTPLPVPPPPISNRIYPKSVSPPGTCHPTFGVPLAGKLILDL